MSQAPRVFLARGGRVGQDEELALENNLSIIGFLDIPSIKAAKSYEDVVQVVAAARPEAKPRAIGNFAGQLWAFAISMRVGDIVVMPRKLTSQIALGRVKGPYDYRKIAGEFRHVREVEWVHPDLPRTTFEQDLLYSFGALMTVCNISRNDADRRVQAVLAGQPDPGAAESSVSPLSFAQTSDESVAAALPDLAQLADDQIVKHIQIHFSGHALADLVAAVLRAEGWVIRISPPGADGGADILAGRGSLGLDGPRLCVQVKSQNTPTDVIVYRTLQGTMQSFKAEQGLLVCWGGFNKMVLQESKQAHFMVRLWDSRDLIEAIYRNYERLPAEIRTALPLKRVWILVPEVSES